MKQILQEIARFPPCRSNHFARAVAARNTCSTLHVYDNIGRCCRLMFVSLYFFILFSKCPENAKARRHQISRLNKQQAGEGGCRAEKQLQRRRPAPPQKRPRPPLRKHIFCRMA